MIKLITNIYLVSVTVKKISDTVNNLLWNLYTLKVKSSKSLDIMHQIAGDDPSTQDIQLLAKQKSHELFAVCDTEEKGFITKRDMQRLQTKLGLDPEHLEAVFDSLDDDQNGYLTLEEFTSGFGSYLGIPPVHDDDSMNLSGDNYEEDMVDKAEEEEKLFNNMMESIGADRVIDDQATVKTLWMKIRHDEPELMSNLEDFLYKVSNDIQRARGDFDSLEAALKSKNTAHDQEIQKLYEEMEYQIKQEKEKILTEEQLKERQLRESMEEELKEKDRQLQELLAKHHEMEKRMSELNQTEVETKLENDKLMKEKEALEEMLESSQENLEESKSYIGQLRSQQKDEKRERARAALRLTENIAMERESLVKQLDLLRDVNKKLRDDKDEAETRRILESEANAKRESFRSQDPVKRGSILGNYFPQSRGRMGSTQDSISELSNDEDLEESHPHHHSLHNISNIIDDIECDDDVITQLHTKSYDHVDSHYGIGMQGSEVIESHNLDQITSSDGEINVRSARQRHKLYKRQRKKDQKAAVDENSVHNTISTGDGNCFSNDIEEDGDNIDQQVAAAYENLYDSNQRRESIFMETMEDYMKRLNEHSQGNQESECHPPLNNTEFAAEKDEKILEKGHNLLLLGNSDAVPVDDTDTNIYEDTNETSFRNGIVPESPRGQPVGEDKTDEEVTPPPRQRLFKVVFVGDSGVGKSCFIHRFCNDQFNPTFSATIGVDFQVKSIVLESQVIVLQLWDTAGQERYRSITKQYFRKADGVIMMYDVTTEATFTNVRNWVTSVKDGVEEGTAMVVVGNKTDLIEEQDRRAVKTKDGNKLAAEYDATFFEVSAKSGVNIKECMEALARILKEKEDDEIEKALHLEDSVEKKGGCCS
ncbi:EF-hand calcium-binding domain-containing protein 4B-like isoform X2 [Ostrea edulis]|uniref:EF-hand calcium-binding domain-containing protein 4B-like isoform X2 n=1 Tax=Ostrea edulis TaxID=37623 RepID=UPI0024AF6154|nr:EF-hand calcium-binding domain-containing protein 4B-like isoform X2 [Ostrea edulis]